MQTDRQREVDKAFERGYMKARSNIIANVLMQLDKGLTVEQRLNYLENHKDGRPEGLQLFDLS